MPHNQHIGLNTHPCDEEPEERQLENCAPASGTYWPSLELAALDLSICLTCASPELKPMIGLGRTELLLGTAEPTTATASEASGARRGARLVLR